MKCFSETRPVFPAALDCVCKLHLSCSLANVTCSPTPEPSSTGKHGVLLEKCHVYAWPQWHVQGDTAPFYHVVEGLHTVLQSQCSQTFPKYCGNGLCHSECGNLARLVSIFQKADKHREMRVVPGAKPSKGRLVKQEDTPVRNLSSFCATGPCCKGNSITMVMTEVLDLRCIYTPAATNARCLVEGALTSVISDNLS